MHPIAVKVIQEGYEWWDLIPAILGGIIGALAGGLPAYALAKRATKEALARDSKVRDELDRAKAFRIFGTLQAIVNSFFTTRMMIDEMLERPIDPNERAPIQKRVNAMVGFTGEMSFLFHPDDLALLVAANHPDYLTDLELVSRRHAAIMSGLQSFGEFKDRLGQLLLEATKHEFAPDGTVVSHIPTDLAPRVQISEMQLESIIAPLVQMLHDNTELVIKTAEQFGPIMKSYFGSGGGKIPAFDVADLREKYLKQP